MVTSRNPSGGPESGQTRLVHLRLPQDIVERIDAEAKRQGRPFNRIVINELSLVPWWKEQAKLGQLVQNMEVVLAKYGARVDVANIGQELLMAIDDALAAETDSQLQSRLDKVRVLRTSMRKHYEARWEEALGADERLTDARLKRFLEAERRAAEYEQQRADAERRLQMVRIERYLAEEAQAARGQSGEGAQAPAEPPDKPAQVGTVSGGSGDGAE